MLLGANAFAKRRVALVRSILDSFGLTVNEAKSQLHPTRRLDHLGLTVDFARRAFAAPATKVAKLLAAARELVVYAAAHRRFVNKK